MASSQDDASGVRNSRRALFNALLPGTKKNLTAPWVALLHASTQRCVPYRAVPVCWRVRSPQRDGRLRVGVYVLSMYCRLTAPNCKVYESYVVRCHSCCVSRRSAEWATLDMPVDVSTRVIYDGISFNLEAC